MIGSDFEGMQVHIVIASDEVLANYIPILIAKYDGVLKAIYIALSPTMNKSHSFSNLKRALKKEESVSIKVSPEFPESNPIEIRTFAEKLIGEAKDAYPNCKIVFNATGGKKNQCIAFAQIAEDEGCEIIYADTANTQIEFLSRDSKVTQPVPMRSVLNIESYFYAQGFRIENCDSDAEDWKERAMSRRKTTETLFEQFLKYDWLLQKLNSGISNSGNQPSRNKEFFVDKVTGGKVESLLKVLQNSNMVHYEQSENGYYYVVTPSDPEILTYLNGKWLEEFLWFKLRNIPEIELSCGLSVKPLTEKSDLVNNEFDLAMVSNNRLLIIECKSGKVDGSEENRISYKLNDVPKRLGGALTTVVLASMQTVGDEARKRLASRTEVFVGSDIAGLSSRVSEWSVM